jgi:dipeptidyl aminopeptidase/acylaminoacyl peptidase
MYVPGSNGSSGTLLSAEGDWVEARRFDMTSLSVTGDPRKIDVAAAAADPHHAALLSASPDILAFSALPIPYGAHLTSLKGDGTDVRSSPTQELGFFLRLSPDEGRIARVRVDPVAGNHDLWVTDLKRGGDVRITTSRDIDVLPVWSPNGTQIAYRSGINAAPTLVVTAADGTGSSRTLRCPSPYCEPTDWVQDTLIVNASDGNVWSVPVTGAEPRQVLHDAFVERDARVSPNGLWIAYVSEESGHPEVFVRSLSGPDRKFPVSTSGGDQPVWRRDGRKLFYVNPEGFLEGATVGVAVQGRLEFGSPKRLMVPQFAPRHWGTTYDVSTEERVYFPSEGEDTFPRDVGVVLGWSMLAR